LAREVNGFEAVSCTVIKNAGVKSQSRRRAFETKSRALSWLCDVYFRVNIDCQILVYQVKTKYGARRYIMSNIVWIASYPKSGNTWMRVFLCNLLSAGSEVQDINKLGGFCNNESNAMFYRAFFEQPLADVPAAAIAKIRAEIQKNIAIKKTGTTFLKSHNYMGFFDGYPLHNLQLTAGWIYIVRNPLDVVISMTHHYGVSVDDAIEFLNDEETATQSDDYNVFSPLSSWSTHVASWTNENHPLTCYVRYEDLLDKELKTFRRVASMLGIKDIGAIKQAIKKSSFLEMKKQEARNGFVERTGDASPFFRRGKKDQWAERLTAAQIQRVIDKNRAQMERFGYMPKAHGT